jgi:hypothetical protein
MQGCLGLGTSCGLLAFAGSLSGNVPRHRVAPQRVISLRSELHWLGEKE